ncbi:MAG: Slp family lipoprotein, partial [Candidatus Binatia bacterium]
MLRVVLAAVVLLGACVRPPVQLAGQFPPTSIAEARGDGHEGERVRWGGIIVTATPEKSATCFELVALPLDRRARPRETDATPGRFVA